MSKHKQYGFTIVELLIVIVVIGILAAITVVAFSGIQSRAKVAKKHSEISSISKAALTNEITSSTLMTLNNVQMTPAQIDAAIISLGLSGMRNSIVVDSPLTVNNDNCRQSPMTKDKYCVAIMGKDARVVYWNDQQSKWIERQYSAGSSTEGDIGTGAYPDLQSY